MNARTGIDGPAFKTDRAAKAALGRAMYHRGAAGYTVIARHGATGNPRAVRVTVTLKYCYAGDVQGHGPSLRVAAHRALCSAGYR